MRSGALDSPVRYWQSGHPSSTLAAYAPRLANLRILVILGFILFATITALAQSPFTLEQVLSSPFPTGLVAAAHGSRVAWVFDAKGVRNVWVADGPDFAMPRARSRITTQTTASPSPVCGSRPTARRCSMRWAAN